MQEGGVQVMNKKGGFTLIELLVVVLIIGILASVAVPSYRKAVLKSQAAELLTLANSALKAQQVYYMSTGTYAFDLDALDLDFPGEPYSGPVSWAINPAFFPNMRAHGNVAIAFHNNQEMVVMLIDRKGTSTSTIAAVGFVVTIANKVHSGGSVRTTPGEIYCWQYGGAAEAQNPYRANFCKIVGWPNRLGEYWTQ